MQQFLNRIRVMEAETIQKNAASLKRVFVFLMLVCASMNVPAQRVINLNDENADFNLRAALADIIPQELLKEAKAYRVFAINPALQNAKSVSVGDIVNLQLFEGKTYTATVSNIVTNVNGNFTLTLKLPDYPMAFAIITTSPEGKSLVTVSIPEFAQNFGSRYGSDARSYLIEIDESKIERTHFENDDISISKEAEVSVTDVDGNVKTPPLRSAQASCGPDVFADPDNPATIDLLVVYTPAAASYANSYGGINNIISTMIAWGNTCFSSSQTGITLTLVHSELVSYIEENEMTTSQDNEISTSLRRLCDPYDGYMDNVHELRRQYNADLVQLIGTNGGGMGDLLNVDSNYDKAFSVVNIGNIASPSGGRFSSVHEIGHNMGLAHGANMIDPGTGIFSYSYGWDWQGGTNKYCSVMSYPDSRYYSDEIARERVSYFSNPNINIDYSGISVAIGDAAKADASRSLREMKHVIASYSDRAANLPATPTNIVVSNPTDNGATFSWDACANAIDYRIWNYTSPTASSASRSGGSTLNVTPSPRFQPCTTYEVWITAINECGDEVRSQKITFKTKCPTDPTVTTSTTVTDITHNSATLDKTVTANGSVVTSQGFMYKEMSSAVWKESADGNLTELIPDTQYKFYAYAITAEGTFNGRVSTFTTLAEDPTVLKKTGHSEIAVYPNPATDFLYVSETDGIEWVVIRNIAGVPVSEFGAISGTVNVKNLLPGVYFMEIKTKSGSETVKFIKK
ncbi:MAG: T9SS type A sorting domain-containing protein [Candidatus Azobacteroides sp.]|nr:T9SS type A sorting domain-containing protein [Candidatus Azobacteroides sp.]